MKYFNLKSKVVNRLYLLSHPILLALYFFLLFLYLTPEYFSKYNAEIIDAEHRHGIEREYYYDLNGDGISERVCAGYNGIGNEIRIQHYNLNGNIYNQWKPRGEWLRYHKPYIGDYNNNGFAEIYCLSIEGDSIFLSIKELMLEDGLEIINRFVCKAGLFDSGKNDIVDWGGELMDVDGDKLEEYVFFLHGGFSKTPRNGFKYYISIDSLVMSPVSASGITKGLHFMDLNGDGIEEITGHVGSPENIHYPIPYTDSAGWLMVFDPATMGFHFSPLRFNVGIGSGIDPVFCNVNSNKYIAVSVLSNSASLDVNKLQLRLYDSKGLLLKENNIDQSQINRLCFFSPQEESNNSFYLIDDLGNIYKTDTSLVLSGFLMPGIEGTIVQGSQSYILDIDYDGVSEVLFLGVNRKSNTFLLLIYEKNFTEVVVVDLPGAKSTNNPHFSMIKNQTEEPSILMLQVGSYTYKIKYGKNPYSILRYLIYAVVYLLLFSAFWLLQRIQNQYALRKFEEEKRLAKQQMALAKRQLEPHFMLNTLNNIGEMFANEDREKAQYYFGKFVSLIHRALLYTDKTETTLFEELGFVRDYLVLQQKRFNTLEFSIETNNDIDLKEILIPHSLVYTFVENALKHGLWHKEGNKDLEIIIKKQLKRVVVIITDNGIGRHQSVVIKTTGTGKGFAIITNIVKMYNKLNNRNISYKVNDLHDENGKGIGTKVEVFV